MPSPPIIPTGLLELPILDAVLHKARSIRLLILDVDGVLTDGSIVYSENSGEIKSFHVWDGFAIRVLQRFGIEAAIISGRRSEVVSKRAKELDIAETHQGFLDKLPAFSEILERRGLRPEETCMVGDDLPDLPLLRRAGLGIAPADAHPLIKPHVHYVTRHGGGAGAVREVAELLLFARDSWNEYLSLFGT